MTQLEGLAVDENEILFPICNSLPMGFAWSLFFAQVANATRLNRQPSLRHSLLLSDRGKALVLGPEGKSGHYMYVDNLGLLSKVSDHVPGATWELCRVCSEANRLLQD